MQWKLTFKPEKQIVFPATPKVAIPRVKHLVVHQRNAVAIAVIGSVRRTVITVIAGMDLTAVVEPAVPAKNAKLAVINADSRRIAAETVPMLTMVSQIHRL